MTPDPKQVQDLTAYFLDKVQAAAGRRLLTSPRSVAPFMRKLLAAEMTPELIRLTIDWLTTDNLESEYPYVVLSGRALVEKWDRIQNAMEKDRPYVSLLPSEADKEVPNA
jgi:hypothetical protein